MNILLLGNAFPPTYMGGESSHLHCLAKGLRAKGHRVYVVHPMPTREDRISLTLSNVETDLKVYRIGLPEGKDHENQLNIVFLDIWNRLRREGVRIDLVHCHSNRFSSALGTLSKTQPTPLVSTVHAVHIALVQEVIRRRGIALDPSEQAMHDADTARQSDLCALTHRIIAISRAMGSYVAKFFGADDSRIRHVYNGVDFTTLSEFSEPHTLARIRRELDLEAKVVVLYSGRVEPIKGIVPLAEACKRLCGQFEEVAFLFLGNGSADPWLRSCLDKTRNVHFLNWLPFEALIPYYHLADIAVTPSLIEPFGLVPLEAMACRTCVIASNADGLDEIVQDGLNGVKIPIEVDEYGDRRIRAEDICEAIGKAIREPEWRRILAERGIRRASEFTVDRMIQQTEQVYLELLH
ncbi:MAG: glycosyltransferase family 4 protein [Deltaproteobacteria bacterium]|nr:glycosyltransferase family 4 protein [Deltaproteobacteria bacterium]